MGKEEMKRVSLFSDTQYLFVRAMKKFIRTPILIFLSLFQPLLFLLLFTQLFKNFANIPGFPTGSYLEFAAPGILLQNAFSSALQSGTSLVVDLDTGFLQKMLVTPVSRYAILLGRLTSDAFRVVLQSLIILIVAYFLGATVVTGILGVVLILITIAFFGLAWSGISLTIGLRTRSSESVFGIGFVLTFPLLFMSTALTPLSFMPSWIQSVSSFNPVSYTVNAVRVIMLNGFDAWTTILSAYAVTALVALVSMGSTLYQFRKVIS